MGIGSAVCHAARLAGYGEERLLKKSDISEVVINVAAIESA
jgi:hypothetical protein